MHLKILDLKPQKIGVFDYLKSIIFPSTNKDQAAIHHQTWRTLPSFAICCNLQFLLWIQHNNWSIWKYIMRILVLFILFYFFEGIFIFIMNTSFAVILSFYKKNSLFMMLQLSLRSDIPSKTKVWGVIYTVSFNTL